MKITQDVRDYAVVKRTPEQKMAEIDQAINAIFLQYPHRAGTP
jgi:hypothetical protein